MAVTVYNGHNIANMDLDAITLGVETHEQDDLALGSDLMINHRIILSIRVHTAYANQDHEQQATIELLDAIVTKLKQNINLPNQYRLMGFSASNYRADFEESASRGGQVDITVHIVKTYTQE